MSVGVLGCCYIPASPASTESPSRYIRERPDLVVGVRVDQVQVPLEPPVTERALAILVEVVLAAPTGRVSVVDVVVVATTAVFAAATAAVAAAVVAVV